MPNKKSPRKNLILTTSLILIFLTFFIFTYKNFLEPKLPTLKTTSPNPSSIPAANSVAILPLEEAIKKVEANAGEGFIISKDLKTLSTRESFLSRDNQLYNATGFTVMHPGDRKVYDAGSLESPSRPEVISFARCNGVETCHDSELVLFQSSSKTLAEWLAHKNYFQLGFNYSKIYQQTFYPLMTVGNYPAIAIVQTCRPSAKCASKRPSMTIGIQLNNSVIEGWLQYDDPLLIDILGTIEQSAN